MHESMAKPAQAQSALGYIAANGRTFRRLEKTDRQRQCCHHAANNGFRTTAVMPQISPVILWGARGDDPLAPLDVPDRQQDGLAVPAWPSRNIARSYTRMAEAIRDRTAAEPDFDHALEVHRLLETVRKSSDQQRVVGVGR